MNKKIMLLSILCYCMLANATTGISLSGTVTDSSGTKLKGAYIYLKSDSSIVTHSDSSGAFTLSSSGIKSILSVKSSSFSASVRNNRVVFSTTEAKENAAIDVYSVKGDRISSVKMTGLAAGNHAAALPALAGGIYFVKLTVGDETRLVKIASGMNTVVTTSSVTSRSSSSVGKKASHASDVVDTLIVVMQGYKNALEGISSYSEQAVSVKLGVSNPWIPSGSLTRSGNMVKILAKGYDFEMGQPDPDLDYSNSFNGTYISEQPVHTVNFTYDFWMDTTEVTQKSYDSIMMAKYSDYVSLASSGSWLSTYGVGDNYPAYYLAWGNAVLYCNARSKIENLDTVYSYSDKTSTSGETCDLIDVTFDITKNGYRLPTEAEWEYACKGGTVTDFFWKKNADSYPSSSSDTIEAEKYAVWYANSSANGLGKSGFGVHVVASTTPNAYGLYDMSGNVSEYCNDYQVGYDYGSVTDPTGPSSGDYYTVRGGNWDNDAVKLRSADRNALYTNYQWFACGFRTVRTVK